MNRVTTGIAGLDRLVGGGFPESDIILLSGECGTGKSVFGLQFLLRAKEPGVYLSFEDEVDRIESTAALFGWDIRALHRANKIRVLRYDPFRLEDVIEILESHIREVGAKRVVVDSMSALGMYMKEAADLRRTMLQMESVLRKNRCTSLFISEIIPGERGISRFGVEEFVTDGVIVMRKYQSGAEMRRGLVIWKMRGTGHSNAIHSYEISGKGISVGAKMRL